MKKLSIKQFGYIVFAVIIIVSLLFLNLGVLDDWDFFFQDALYQKKRPVATDVVIVAIDDESLDLLGKWPWPREYHGQLLERIDSGSPLAIGVDVLFLEESEEDEAFLDSLKRMSKKPVFACYGSLAESADAGMIRPEVFYPPFDAALPYVELAHINTLPDGDGMVRRTLIEMNVEGLLEGQSTIKSMAYRLYRLAYGKEPDVLADAWHRMPIRYAGNAGTFERVPYHMVLTGEIDPEYFRDKIVLIGVMAIGLADDYYFTPIDRAYPMYGIEVHANIIRQFLDGLRWVEVDKRIESLILIVLSLLSIWYGRWKMLYSTLAAVFTILLYLGVAIALSGLRTGYLLGISYVVLAVVLIYIVNNVLRYVAERMERKRVTDVFGKYMEPRLVERVLKGGEDALGLGGVKRLVTVLFVDIRGFTTMSENLEPEQVVSILNEYLNLCAEAIFKYEGTLDKYIGDAAMALFGAPLEIEDHAFKAVQTAYHMQQGAQRLSARLMEKYGRTVSFGVGVNTGDAVVGNIGASHRLDYTAIGDAVNTAARLESNAKPGQVLLSAATYAFVKDRVDVRPLGELSVKGKSRSIEVYELIGIREMQQSNTVKHNQAQSKATHRTVGTG